jgi:hypothetical protein
LQAGPLSSDFIQELVSKANSKAIKKKDKSFTLRGLNGIGARINYRFQNSSNLHSNTKK